MARKKKSLNEHKSSLKLRRTPPGTVPGALIADPNSPAPRYGILQYGPNNFVETPDASLDQVMACSGSGMISWINVEGLGDVEAVQQIGRLFQLHPLALEDVVNVHQRPKMEAYKDVLFVVARMPHPEAIPATEQVAFFLGANFLIT
ncbi:MAG: magnesium and cobalt transport protein CorA, partial [Candidatus Melainabacteria bacterium HGW-Melainabacteria-1]